MDKTKQTRNVRPSIFKQMAQALLITVILLSIALATMYFLNSLEVKQPDPQTELHNN